MRVMHIAVEGATLGLQDDRGFWPFIERFISAMAGEPGYLNRIRRPDGGCNYRARGTYELGFVAASEEIRVELCIR